MKKNVKYVFSNYSSATHVACNVALAWTFNIWINWIMMLTNTRTSRSKRHWMPHTLPLRVAGKPHHRGSPTPRLSGPHSPVTVVACWALVGCYTVRINKKKRLRTTSLSVIQQLSQLPLLHASLYVILQIDQYIRTTEFIIWQMRNIRPNFGTRWAPSAKTLASAEHCKGMFGAPLVDSS